MLNIIMLVSRERAFHSPCLSKHGSSDAHRAEAQRPHDGRGAELHILLVVLLVVHLRVPGPLMQVLVFVVVWSEVAVVVVAADLHFRPDLLEALLERVVDRHDDDEGERDDAAQHRAAGCPHPLARQVRRPQAGHEAERCVASLSQFVRTQSTGEEVRCRHPEEERRHQRASAYRSSLRRLNRLATRLYHDPVSSYLPDGCPVVRLAPVDESLGGGQGATCGVLSHVDVHSTTREERRACQAHELEHADGLVAVHRGVE